MFGFNVRTWQNGFGSPKSVGSPSSVGSPGRTESPKADVGEVDTRAPFESVKAAVSLFGEVGSPRARPVTKKTKAEEQRLLEKEAQHHMVLRELDHHKDQLRSTESAKAQAQRDLQMANRTVQELANKLEALSESMQAAIRATEAAKSRTKELQEQKSLKAQLGCDAWKVDVDNERELYKASSGELIRSKQELTSLRQDFDAALEAKLAAYNEAESARQAAKTNQQTQSQLSKELAMLSNTLDEVKLASLQTEEEHLKLIAEKEVHLLVHKSAKEAAVQEIRRLKEEYGPEENLEEKLEETTEAIKVLQEQLNDVRASDMRSLQAVVSELDQAKNELQGAVEEGTSIRSSVDSLNLQVDEVKRNLSEFKKLALEAEARVEQMQADLDNTKTELDEAMSRNVITEMQSQLEKLLAEAEKDKQEAEEIRKEVELLRQETEAAISASKEADEKVETALKEAEAAKVSLKLADDQIRNSPRTDVDDLKDPGSSRKIKLSAEEFKSMNHKIEECRNQADEKVAILMAQVQNLNASNNEILQKVEGLLKESHDIQSEIEDALKKAEMAEAAKSVVEGELMRWRRKGEDNVGEPSSILDEK